MRGPLRELFDRNQTVGNQSSLIALGVIDWLTSWLKFVHTADVSGSGNNWAHGHEGAIH